MVSMTVTSIATDGIAIAIATASAVAAPSTTVNCGFWRSP